MKTWKLPICSYVEAKTKKMALKQVARLMQEVKTKEANLYPPATAYWMRARRNEKNPNGANLWGPWRLYVDKPKEEFGFDKEVVSLTTDDPSITERLRRLGGSYPDINQ